MRKLSKRIFAFLLAAVMLLPMGIFSENPFVQEASAATDKTSKDAIDWLVSKNGQELDYDGAYGAQCVDLICYYYRFLGAKSPGGHARDYATNKLPSGWTRTKGGVPQKGDILIYAGNGLGHVAIYESDNGVWHQRSYVRTAVTKTKQYYKDIVASCGSTYWGCIHPVFADSKPSVSQPTSSTSNYVGGVKVTLTTSTSGATIYYTTNGSNPTTSSTKYTEAFNLTSTATVKAIAVKNGMNNSSVMSKKITVDKVATPVISNKLASNGFNMTITADKNATIYYTTDGKNPTTSSTKYSGQFTVYQNTTIKAIAVASGKANSAVASAALSANAPGVPTVKLDSSSKNTIGIGDSVSVSWSAVSNAYEYKAILSKDGSQVDTFVTQGSLATFTPDSAGTYTITVKAVNFAGESAASSPAINVTVKPDVTVTFKDYDGKVIVAKKTKYGSSVTAPVPTQRTGYDFSMWSGKYTNVTVDSTVTAVYTPKQYTVTFVDEDGNKLAQETVKYGEAAKSIPTAPAKTGYKFAAWSVVSGEGNSYTKVNGAATFEPTYAWANPDLPLVVTAQKAVRSTDLKSYDVSVKIINGTNQVVNGKIVAVIKTANDKVVATAIQAVAVPANASNYTSTVKIGATADGMLAEVYVLANDTEHDSRTGGALSEVTSVKVTKEVSTTEKYWSDWSGWSTTAVTASSTREVETKVQYRYRDKQTTTSTSSTLSGWTQSGSTVSYGSWSSWSGWSTTKQTETDVKDVETRKAYKYYHYCNGSNGIAPSTKYTYGVYGPHYHYATTKKITNYCETTGLPLAWGLTKCEKGVNGYYYDCEVTQYRYRTRSKTTTYSYWKWGNYSSWSDTVVSATDTRQVEKQTVYRYRDLKEKASTGSSDYIVTENLSGTKYTFNGKLTNVATDYSGKVATIMVYKKQNVDSLEFQLEYIGQIKLGSGNSYSFSFIPRQEISAETGDYIVSFGIATANGLVNNVEIVEAPKPSYKVDFYDIDGKLLKSENVAMGGSATAPELPEVDGYELRWDRTFTNIYSATTIKAEKIKKSYDLIFVDWENNEIVEIREAEYDSIIKLPDARSATGKKFVGWSVPEGAKVTGDMVIEAVYEDIMFTVTFLNKDDSVFETQSVPYGDAVVIPYENPVAEGYEFLTWDNNSKWWSVTSDITVKPIFIYDSTVEAPVFTLTEDASIGFAQVEMETSTEGAEIRYTTDGTEPTEESLLFDDVVYVDETTTFKAVAFKDGMVASQSVENTFEVIPSEVILNTKVSSVTNTDKYVIGTDKATLCMRIDNPFGYEILSWGYVITNIATEETATYENKDIAGTKDTVIGRAFGINGLDVGTVYSYYFFAEFEELGMFESEYAEFRTGCNVTIRTPSNTTIKYGDAIKLHADVDGTLPAGAYIEWSANNSNFTVTNTDGEICEITPKSSGDTTFIATVYDENGNILSSDTQVMKSKAGFFDKFAAFFRKLFGMLKVYEQAIK